jgi:hypothetical protein
MKNMNDNIAMKAQQSIEQYMMHNNITQITYIPRMEISDEVFLPSWAIVVGNDRYFGQSVDECVAQSGAVK